jgi:hypothetical protein
MLQKKEKTVMKNYSILKKIVYSAYKYIFKYNEENY